jgi:ribosomal protein S18 acetylase RimI-like enzyme
MTIAIAGGAAVSVPSIRQAAAGRRLRPACRADARAVAELMAIAGDGIPEHLWGLAAGPGETRLDVGTRRAARDEGGFSWINAVLAERRGGVVGLMLGYVLDSEPTDAAALADLPPVVRPFVELEGAAPGAFYVNALAVRPGHRGLGLGSRLLDAARDRARARGAATLAITAFEGNAGAVRLYRRHGYAIVARRPVVRHACHPYDGDVVLLVRPV